MCAAVNLDLTPQKRERAPALQKFSQPNSQSVHRLFQWGIGGGVILRLEAIWVRRSRRESPISEKTLVQVCRSFSSAVAAMPETTSRDWWSSEATVASIH